MRRLAPLLPSAARVQGVAEAVPDEVHGEDAEGDGDAGEDDRVLTLDKDPEAAAEGVGEHRAPLRGRCSGAEAQEREGGHVQYGGREGEGGLHDQGSHAIREHAGEDDLGVARPEGALGLDVVALPNGDDRRAHDPRYLRNEHDAYSEHRVWQARPEHGDDDDGEQDAREGQDHVHEAHQHRVGPAADVSGHDPDYGPHARRYRDGGEPGGERYPRAVDHPREDVPPQLVLAHEVCPTGWRELSGEILPQRVVRRDQGRKDGHQDEDAYNGRPEDRQAVRKERAQEVLPAAARLDAGGGYRVVLDLRLGHLSTSPGDRGSRRGCPRGGSPARRAGPRRGLRPGSWRSPGGRRTRRRCNPPPARRRSSPL